MTAQEQIQIKQLRDAMIAGQKEILKSQVDFQKEVRGKIKTINEKIDHLPQTYLQLKWITNSWKVVSWLIGILLAVWGLLIYGSHK